MIIATNVTMSDIKYMAVAIYVRLGNLLARVTANFSSQVNVPPIYLANKNNTNEITALIKTNFKYIITHPPLYNKPYLGSS